MTLSARRKKEECNRGIKGSRKERAWSPRPTHPRIDFRDALRVAVVKPSQEPEPESAFLGAQ